MASTELSPDQKGQASLVLHDVVKGSFENFPDKRFQPQVIRETSYYTIAQIKPEPYGFWPTGDGIGTKPEFAERLFTSNGDPANFESLAHDVFAMVAGDEDRWGRFMVGVVEVIDLNSADDKSVISSLAKGMQAASKEGQFAILNGETAELGYRTSGYGNTRINWNAVGLSIVNPDKLILGDDLKPGQPVVAFREKSIRSNGLTRARAILEQRYLLQETPFTSKSEYVAEYLRSRGMKGTDGEIIQQITNLFGHDALDQVLLPWHIIDPETTRLVKEPSKLYGAVIYDAQGGVDGKKKVNMIAAAHISGGGVPEKGKRMVESKGLGLSIDSVFPDPGAVSKLMEIDLVNSARTGKRLVDDKGACEQWNRAIGFLTVLPNLSEANEYIAIAASHNVEAAVVGKTIDKREIQFRGYTWIY